MAGYVDFYTVDFVARYKKIILKVMTEYVKLTD